MIYKITIAPKGAVGTPFRSDTLFGHACWCLLYTKGEERLASFLQNARDQKPEVVFSDGFPSGYVPKPLLPPKTPAVSSPDDQRRFKKLNKKKWVRLSDAEEAKWDISSACRVTEEGYSDAPHSVGLLHNVIDRLTGTSLDENGLYSASQEWYGGIWKNIDIYIASSWSLDEITAFTTDLFSVGYGKDQTVGCGAVSIVSPVTPVNFPSPSPYGMTLSRMVPDSSVSLHESYYDVETKYGKVWSGLHIDNPFKKPVLQLIPGSVLSLSSQAEFVGTVITDISADPRVIENCFGIIYPLPAEVCSGQ